LNVNTGNIPYPVFALAGMSAWSYFAFVLNQSGTSIIGAQDMVKKVYFPQAFFLKLGISHGKNFINN